MDKNMKRLYLTIIILVFAGSVSAQGLASFTYNVSMPTANLKEYIDAVSWRGFGIEGRWFTTKNVSFGLSLSWNVFDKRSDELIQIDNGEVIGAVSGTQIRTVNSFPIVGTAHYYTGSRRDPARFYFGANLGLYYIRQRLEIGINTYDSNNWHFGLAPEAGVLFELSRSVVMVVKSKYNYAFSSGTTVGGSDENAISYFEFGVGFVWQGF